MWVYNEKQQQENATRKFLWTIFRQVFHVWETREEENRKSTEKTNKYLLTCKNVRKMENWKWKNEKENDARAKRVKLNQKFSNFKSNLLILVMQISPRRDESEDEKTHLHNKPMLFFHLGIFLFFIKAIFSFS